MLKPQQKPSSKTTFSGRVLFTFENGNVISERVVGCHELIASLDAFVEIAKAAGWHVHPAEAESSALITPNPADNTHQALPEPLPAVGERYTQNEGGMSAIVRRCAGKRVVFSYEPYPAASHDYSLEAFIREFTRLEVRHA